MESLDDAEDKRLMAALAAGEAAALDRLMERWQQPVRRFIFRYVQNEADSDDLVQETFVRIFNHRTRYRPQSRFSTWLFTIAVNLCRNHAEKWSRRRAESLDRPAADAGAGGASHAIGREHASSDSAPDDALVTGERAAAVRAAIAELPHDLRTAVLLFEYDGLSHAEIAAINATTPKAIETRLYRARRLLRERLARFLES
jgi:RNA polymerase sigma-70 factor (ECF subfamily)